MDSPSSSVVHQRPWARLSDWLSTGEPSWRELGCRRCERRKQVVIDQVASSDYFLSVPSIWVEEWPFTLGDGERKSLHHPDNGVIPKDAIFVTRDTFGRWWPRRQRPRIRWRRRVRRRARSCHGDISQGVRRSSATSRPTPQAENPHVGSRIRTNEPFTGRGLPVDHRRSGTSRTSRSDCCLDPTLSQRNPSMFSSVRTSSPS